MTSASSKPPAEPQLAGHTGEVRAPDESERIVGSGADVGIDHSEVDLVAFGGREIVDPVKGRGGAVGDRCSRRSGPRRLPRSGGRHPSHLGYDCCPHRPPTRRQSCCRPGFRFPIQCVARGMSTAAPSRPQAHHHGGGGVFISRRIGSRTAFEEIGAGFAVQPIIAVSTVEVVIAVVPLRAGRLRFRRPACRRLAPPKRRSFSLPP